MSTIKIAVQKSGRLNEDSLQLLKDCGISIDNGIDQLKAAASNFPLEVLYLRNGDIPQYLRDGVVDIAIIGENVLIEKGNYPKDSIYVSGQQRTDMIFQLIEKREQLRASFFQSNVPIILFATQPQQDAQMRKRIA